MQRSPQYPAAVALIVFVVIHVLIVVVFRRQFECVGQRRFLRRHESAAKQPIPQRQR
jgi:hypothetical protein